MTVPFYQIDEVTKRTRNRHTVKLHWFLLNK
jgi:hypothetical protein